MAQGPQAWRAYLLSLNARDAQDDQTIVMVMVMMDAVGSI